MEKSGRSGDPRVHTSDHGVCREDIQILKTLAAPPQGVKDVLQAVSLLLGHPVHVATNYKKCLMMLSGVGENSLVHLIQARDVQSVDSATASRAREILKPYTEVTIRSMCQASVGLYSWVRTWPPPCLKPWKVERTVRQAKCKGNNPSIVHGRKIVYLSSLGFLYT